MRREGNFLIFWKPDLLTRFDIFIPTKKESTHGGLIDSAQGLRMPRVMSSARRLNDGMGEYVAHQVIKHMNLKGVMVKDAKILTDVMGSDHCPIELDFE